MIFSGGNCQRDSGHQPIPSQVYAKAALKFLTESVQMLRAAALRACVRQEFTIGWDREYAFEG
jgi:hypothetical protein